MNAENNNITEGGKQKVKIADHRFLARIVIEAKTPLSVKSGNGDITTDSVVMTDVNGLPYIPGSSIAGVVRHAYKEIHGNQDMLFGYQGSESGVGSRVIFSEARILDSKGVVMDGLLSPGSIDNDKILILYRDMPIRQHVRINHYGTAEDSGKFDEQVVFAGTRFCFEIEMLATGMDKCEFRQLLDILRSDSFRIGGGSRKGFGKIGVISLQYASMPVSDERYLEKSSNLEKSKAWYDKYKEDLPDSGLNNRNINQWKKYNLELSPDNFFLFGSGFSDDDVDMTPVKETKIKWESDTSAEACEHCYLVPASSIKGALAHRVAYHYNRLTGVFADDFVGADGKETMKKYVGGNNPAVRILFGSEGDPNGAGKLRGNVLLSDLYQTGMNEKVLNHVAIDRFTGGAIDGALFSEKVVYGKGSKFALEIYVDEKGVENLLAKKPPVAGNLSAKETIMIAFESALGDICNGLLPLGGGVNRGNGIFTGKQTKP